MEIKTIGVMTSGGDVPGLNAAIHAILHTANKKNIRIIGITEGFDGLIDGKFSSLDLHAVRQAMDEGGTILRTSRSERFKHFKWRKKANEQLKSKGIDACIVIGGNGSLKGAEVFGREFKVPLIGIPKTIDNDIYGTDYAIGFDTALNTIVEATDKIRDTADATSRIFIVEVMGRKSGFLALYSGIASGADVIIIPEVKTNVADMLSYIEHNHKIGNRSMILIITENALPDGGLGLKKILDKKLPEYESRVTILGHIQRGGRPSAIDRMLANRLGHYAITALLKGKKSVMVSILNDKIKYPSLAAICDKKHSINKEMIELANRLSFL
ncbi:MAG: ATP-dependent 6-phosphofructokinase [Bacteroidota bacterium]